MIIDKTPQHIKLDERNHVEKPLLDQLGGLGWEIIDLDNKQHSADRIDRASGRSQREKAPTFRRQIGCKIQVRRFCFDRA